MGKKTMSQAIKRRSTLGLGTAAVVCLTVAIPGCPQVSLAQGSTSPSAAMGAYIYGYSLITTEVTRVQGSNRAKPESMKAPTGQFGNVERRSLFASIHDLAPPFFCEAWRWNERSAARPKPAEQCGDHRHRANRHRPRSEN